MSDSERPSLADLKARYLDAGKPLPRELEEQLKADDRPGAKKLLEAIAKKRKKNRAEGQRLRKLFRYETALWNAGVTRIAGVDEAGMSPLAGPVVAGAVILAPKFRLAGVDDSKKLDAPTREALAVEIKRHAVAWAVGIVEPEEIDRINIYRAGLLAMRRAVEGLSPGPEALLIDARKLPELPYPQQAIIHGDALSFSIAAASIVAKTTRDAMMVELDAKFPGYGLAKHKGYPVREHTDALARLGVSPIHRRSFGPVRRALGLEPTQTELFATE